MSMVIDQQTLDDLNIFGKRDDDTIYGIFSQTHTRGAADLVKQFFRNPLSNAAAINKRSRAIRFFSDNDIAFPYKTDLFDSAGEYLDNTDERTRLVNNEHSWDQRLVSFIASDTEQSRIVKGISSVIEILATSAMFSEKLNREYGSQDDIKDLHELGDLVTIFKIDPSFFQATPVKLSRQQLVDVDHLFRFSHRDVLKKIFGIIYLLDVYISVAKVAKLNGFVFANAETEDHSLEVEGLYHPKMKDAIRNDISIGSGKHLVFLTGANMAGKSTFMKSLGVALFLAHVGFPVAADKMNFPVCDALLTAINISDNISLGYSHFYSEVLRVKKMAEQLHRSKKLFIIFDELFRGTNVKDAFEGTVAVAAAFAEKSNCLFVLSTHIVEAGEKLKEISNTISYMYMPTVMQYGKPVYTYKLKQGITDDRHGMMIIKNEGILDILENGKKG